MPAPSLAQEAPRREAKRQQRRLVTGGLQLATRVLAGWYSDLALVSAGAEEAALNQDRLDGAAGRGAAGRAARLHAGCGGRAQGTRAAPL